MSLWDQAAALLNRAIAAVYEVEVSVRRPAVSGKPYQGDQPLALLAGGLRAVISEDPERIDGEGVNLRAKIEAGPVEISFEAQGLCREVLELKQGDIIVADEVKGQPHYEVISKRVNDMGRLEVQVTRTR